MRVAAVCFASSLAAIASAVAIAAPADDADRESAAQLARPEHRDRAVLDRWALPPVSSAPASPCATDHAETKGVVNPVKTGPRDGADELERLRAELTDLRVRLADAERRVSQLVTDHCQERFDVELDRWLDGPLGWLHEDDAALRERLRDALVTCAEERPRRRVWDPDLQEWQRGDCPEEVDRLRERIPDALVIQLADLFSGWERDQRDRPRVEMSWGCGVSSRVTVSIDGRETSLLREDPSVRLLLAEQERVDREWQLRINALLGARVFEHY